MALNIGELFGTIGLDPTAWNRELAGAQDNLKAFGVAGAAIAAAAAVAIGAAMSKGIADSIDMEAGNDRVQAQLGLTEEQAAVSGKAAGSVFSQNFGESMEDVQVGVSAVMSSIRGMRDASQADIEDMTKRMLTLADVFEIDVSRAAQVAGQMITTGFATDGVHAADLLTDALQKVPAAVREDILDAVDEYAPFMAQLGIAAETGMGLLVNASDKGMYGIDKLGDALKEFTIRSTDMSKTSGEAYEALGLDQQEMSNKLLAGGLEAQTAFGDIVHGLQGIEDPSARAAAAIALFGTPLEDLGVNEIPEFLGQIDPMGDAFDTVAGASDKAMSDVASNAKAGFAGFKRQAQTALIDFVNVNIMPTLSAFAGFLNNTVGPAVTQLGAWITANALPALQAFGGWFSQNQGTIGIIATVIGALLIPVFIRLAVQAALTAAANVVAWTMMGAGAIKTGAIYVAQSYRMIGAFVATAASMTVNAARVVAGWVLMGAQSLIQAARMAAAWVIAMGPIGWIIAAVVGLVALIIANWDTVKTWTVAAFTAVWDFLVGLWNNVSSFLIGVLTEIVLFFTDAWSDAKATTVSIFTSVVDFVRSIPARILDGLSRIGQLHLQMALWILSMKDAAVDKFLGLVDWVRGLPGKILDALGNMGSLLRNAGVQIITGFLSGLQQKFEDVKNFVSGIGEWIADHKGPKAYDLALLVPAGGWIMTGLEKGLRSQMGMLKGTLGDVSSMIESGIQPELAVTGSYTGRGGWAHQGTHSSPAATSAAAPAQFAGNLFLDSGEFLGKVSSTAVEAVGGQITSSLNRLERGGVYAARRL